jgi:hypothetical protein
LGDDLGLLLRISDACEVVLALTFESSVRKRLAQAGAGGGVGVLIVRDLQPLSSRLVEHGEHLGGLSPGTGAGKLDVGDLGADSGLFGDADDLIQRVEDFHGLVAHVADIDAVMRGGGLSPVR